MSDDLQKFVDPHEQHDPHKQKFNVRDEMLPHAPLKLSDLDTDIQERIKHINQELINGLGFIRKHKKSVTIFGSARFAEGTPYYEKARRIGKRIAENGFDVITGGGPGIMEGGNRGAREASREGDSLGFNIELPHEQVLNPYVDDHVNFYYFFTRKVALTFSAEAYLYFPGGFGTFDELFEILTLVQTKKIESVPVILVGSEFWDPVDEFIKTAMCDTYKTIDPQDIDLYTILDDEDEILDIIKGARMRDE